MAHVVFLRAANVGGHQVFKPAQLAAALRDLDVVNLGAAGTFVVRARASAAAVKKAFAARLPFDTPIAVRPGAEVLALVRSEPFRGQKFSKDLRGWVSVLAGPAKLRPRLPILKPAGSGWSLRFETLEGAYALGLWRRRPGNFPSPHAVVEDAVATPATTRFWETFEKLAAILARE